MMFKAYVIGGAFVALLIAFASHDKRVEKRGVEKERASVTKEAEKKNARSTAARSAVTPGNANDVLARYWRD